MAENSVGVSSPPCPLGFTSREEMCRRHRKSSPTVLHSNVWLRHTISSNRIGKQWSRPRSPRFPRLPLAPSPVFMAGKACSRRPAQNAAELTSEGFHFTHLSIGDHCWWQRLIRARDVWLQSSACRHAFANGLKTKRCIDVRIRRRTYLASSGVKGRSQPRNTSHPDNT